MAIKRALIGFQFEGVGLDVDKPGGLCLCWGTWAPHPDSELEWVDALTDLPDAVSTEVNPYTGDWSTSAFNVSFSASDRLARLFLSDQRRAQAALAIAINSSSGVISLGLTTLEGSVIWVDDEAIYLTSHSGSGVYVCTRGFWGSTAVSHTGGALVFTRIPQWEKRLVRLIEHDVETGTERVRWRGLVRDIDQDRGVITVPCDEYLAALTRAEVNQEPRDLARGASLAWDRFTAATYLRGSTLAGYASRVRPTGDGLFCFVDVDGTIGRLGQAALDGRSRFEVLDWIYGPAPDVESGPYEGSVYEVLVVTPDPDVTSIDVATYPDAHPLTVALVLLTSSGTGRNGTFDVLGSRWGLGLDIVDLASWTAEIDRSPHLQIDHLTLGAGGAAVNVLQVVQDTLLRPFGYFLAITIEGLLSIARLGLPTLAAQASAGTGASVYPDGPLLLERALAQQTQQISVVVGGTPGTREATPLVIKEPDRLTRRGLLGDVRAHKYDLQVLDPRRVANPRRSGNEVISALASLLSLGLDTVPRLRVRIADHTVTGTAAPDLGAWVALSDLGPLQDAWLVDADGERVSDVSGAAWIGMVTGRSWDLSNHTYTLTLLLLGYRVGAYVRERAPAAVVAGWNAGTLTATVEADTFGGAPTDPQTFTVGDEVTLYERDGRLASFVARTVTAVTASTITLSGAFDTTPTAGRVIGLPFSNEFANATRYPLTPRPFAAIADEGEMIIEELDGSNSQPDIYGSFVYGGA